MTNTPEQFPLWPDGVRGTDLQEVVVAKPIDELLLMLFGGPCEYKTRVNAAVSYQGYTFSGWMPAAADPDAAPALKKGRTDVASLKAGMMAKASFTAPSMGTRYPTTELLRLKDAVHGERYQIEVTVCTGAPYGDKFRPIVRHTLQALGPSSASWAACFTLVYLGKVNGLVKGMIERGSRDGMTKYLQEAVQTLQTFGPVRLAAAAAPTLPLVAAPPAAAGAAAAGAGEEHAALAELFGGALVQALQPWASFLHALLAHIPGLQGLTTGAVLATLCTATALWALQLALSVVRFVANAGEQHRDPLAWAAHLAFRVVPVPSRLSQVVSTYAFCLLVRSLANRLAPALPAPLSSGSAPERPRSASQEQHRGGALAEDSEVQSGVKYDGYSAAIASAAAEVGRAEGGLTSPRGSGGGHALDQINQASEVALEQIRRGLVRVAAPFAPRESSSRGGSMALDGPRAEAQRLAHYRRPHHHAHNKRHAAAASGTQGQRDGAVGGEGEGGGKARGRGRRRASSAPPPSAAQGGEGGAVAGAEAEAAAAGRLAAGVVTPGASAGTSSGSTSPQRGRRRSRLSPSPGNEDHSPRSDDHVRSTEGYCSPDLPRRLVQRAVVAEVFENERLQPFRGWGHDWPGHFLPTDRAQHWSLRDAASPDCRASQRFAEVTPPLPPGWRWIEEAWHLDLSGVHSDSVDVQGWSYGLDFGWVMFPFAPGAGRK